MHQLLIFIVYHLWSHAIHSAKVYRYIGSYSFVNNSYNAPFKLTPTGIELPCCNDADIDKEGMFKIGYHDDNESSGYHGIYEPLRANPYYVLENKTFDTVNYNDIPKNVLYFRNDSDSILYLTSNIVVIIYDSINDKYYKIGNYSESPDLKYSFYSSLLLQLLSMVNTTSSAPSSTTPSYSSSNLYGRDLLFYALIGSGILGCCVMILCSIVIIQYKKLKRKNTDNMEQYVDNKKYNGPGYSNHNTLGINDNEDGEDNKEYNIPAPPERRNKNVPPPPLPPPPNMHNNNNNDDDDEMNGNEKNEESEDSLHELQHQFLPDVMKEAEGTPHALDLNDNMEYVLIGYGENNNNNNNNNNINDNNVLSPKLPPPIPPVPEDELVDDGDGDDVIITSGFSTPQ